MASDGASGMRADPSGWRSGTEAGTSGRLAPAPKARHWEAGAACRIGLWSPQHPERLAAPASPRPAPQRVKGGWQGVGAHGAVPSSPPDLAEFRRTDELGISAFWKPFTKESLNRRTVSRRGHPWVFSSGSGAAPTAPAGRGRLWGHLRDAVSQAGARRVHVPRLGVSGLRASL